MVLGLLGGCVFVLIDEEEDSRMMGPELCWAMVKGRRRGGPSDGGRIKGIDGFRGSRMSPRSGGSDLDKDDIVIKTHEEASRRTMKGS
jgi:hypothetical protein